MTDPAIVKHQNEIQVYCNDNGGISIKMICLHEGETIVCFGAEHAAAIIDAIEAEARAIAEYEQQNG